MFCIHCGRVIVEDSSFCPFCGKSTKHKDLRFCTFCGKGIMVDSKYCPYCGTSLEKVSTTRPVFSLPKIDLRKILKSRFLCIYIGWITINSILLYKAQDAYSNYFNSTNVSRDHWLSSDRGIYPEDWLYPFKNIFSGIMGQDPVYVYDMSEFVIYTLIAPMVLSLCIYNRVKLFKTERACNTFYWSIWYVSIWMLIVFPMGLFGLDFLGWSFMMGGLIVGIYSYKKTFAKLYGK